MISPVLRSLVRSVVNPVLASKSLVANAITRYFTEISAAGGQYYEIDNGGISVSSGDYIYIKFVADTAQSSYAPFFDGNSGSRVVARTGATGAEWNFGGLADMEVDGISVVNGDPLPTDNKLHEFSARIVVAGVVEWLGINFALNVGLNGILADMEIWTGGDRDTGTLIADFALDEDWFNTKVAINDAAVLGSELVTHGNFDDDGNSWGTTGDGWTFAEGKAVRDGNATNSGIDQHGIFNQGKQYLLKFEVSGRTTGSVIAYVGQGTQNISSGQSVNGTLSFAFISTSDADKLLVNGVGGFDGSIGNVSVREIPAATPYATAVNITQADSEKFMLDINYGWIGENLITQGVWESPAIVNPAWTFDSEENTWTLNGDGSLQALLLVRASEQPQQALFKGSVTNINGGSLALMANASEAMNSVGSYDFTYTYAAGVYQQYKRAGGVINATISKPTLQKLLEIAQ